MIFFQLCLVAFNITSYFLSGGNLPIFKWGGSRRLRGAYKELTWNKFCNGYLQCLKQPDQGFEHAHEKNSTELAEMYTMSFMLKIVVPLYAVTSMLSVGLTYSSRQILEPLQNRRGVLAAIHINFIVVPLLAFGITQVLSLERALSTGLLLIGLAAGAPFLVVLTKLARGDVAFSGTLLVLLLCVTMIHMPLVVPFVVPDATVNAFEIGSLLALTMLLPLAIGLAIKAYAPGLSFRLQSHVGLITRVALVVLIVATVVLYLPSILSIGFEAILGSALLTVFAFMMGYFFINRASNRRSVLAFGTAQRNIAAATLVAQSFSDSGVLVMVVVSSLIGFAVLGPIAWTLRKRRGANEGQNVEVNETAETTRRSA